MASGNFRNGEPTLVLLSGLPGAGKTTFARAICAALGAEHVESDAIRRALAATPSYTSRESAAVFAIAGRRVEAALAEGRAAVMDATNLTPRDRKRFVAAARRYCAAAVIVRLTAPEEVVRARLAAQREGFSQAGVAVFEQMRTRPRPFTVPVVVADSRFDFRPAIALVLALLGRTPEMPGGG